MQARPSPKASSFSILAAAALASVAGCGDEGSRGSGGNGGGGGSGGSTTSVVCPPGQQIACACPGGGQGVQVCENTGAAFGPCDCGSGPGGSGGNGGSGGAGGSSGLCGNGREDPGECDQGSEVVCPPDCRAGNGGMGGAGGDGGGGPGELCGNGREDPGECDPGSEFFCPPDCGGGAGGSGNGSSGSGGADPCLGFVTLAGLIQDVPSVWGSFPGAMGTGYAAGIGICQTIGADHPCSYTEVQAAHSKGELAGVPMGTTGWVHRITPELVGVTLSDPGPGGRCAGWTYDMNALADGEYVVFNQAGVPTYHLDDDTFYDGVDGSHVQVDLPCGGQTRALFCCFPSCVP